MLTSEESKKLARLRRRAAKRGMAIRFINEPTGGYYAFCKIDDTLIIFDSPRTNDLDAFEQVLDELDAQDVFGE